VFYEEKSSPAYNIPEHADNGFGPNIGLDVMTDLKRLAFAPLYLPLVCRIYDHRDPLDG